MLDPIDLALEQMELEAEEGRELEQAEMEENADIDAASLENETESA